MEWDDYVPEQSLRHLELIRQLPIKEVHREIADIHHRWAGFWPASAGWAPESAAALLGKSRLDRLASLAISLSRWTEQDGEELIEGDLILAWVNLGVLLEGALKLFLCVFLLDYRADEAVRGSKAFNQKDKLLRDPDGVGLDVLLDVAEKIEQLPATDLVFGRMIQQRRNAIHVFQTREIGSVAEFVDSIRRYLSVLRTIDGRLPYPDEGVYRER